MKFDRNTKIGILFLLLLFVSLLFYTQYLTLNSNSLSLLTSAKTFTNQSPAPTCASLPPKCPKGSTCNNESKTCGSQIPGTQIPTGTQVPTIVPTTSVDTIPTSPPEIVTNNHCKSDGSPCFSPTYCWASFSEGPICAYPEIDVQFVNKLGKSYPKLSKLFVHQNDFKFNVMTYAYTDTKFEYDYMYSCNWKSNSDYKKGVGKINNKNYISNVGQEDCSNRSIGEYTYAIKVNIGSPTNPYWIEEKIPYWIVKKNPAGCYRIKINSQGKKEVYSIPIGSCVLSDLPSTTTFSCSDRDTDTDVGMTPSYVTSPWSKDCKSFIVLNDFPIKLSCSLRIVDPPHYIELLPNKCYEQNGKYQICQLNGNFSGKFELKVGEKAYCQNHLQK